MKEFFCEELIDGDVLVAYHGVFCFRTGEEITVKTNGCGELYINCSCGAPIGMTEVDTYLEDFRLKERVGPW